MPGRAASIPGTPRSTFGASSPLLSIATVIAAVVAAALLAVVIGRALTLPPTFDGAMNLQVAWNVAEGNGYTRTYAERAPFPREVQTNGPYVMVAAAVYRAFGMGIVQSQLPNLLFLLLLAGAAFRVARTASGRPLEGLLAVGMVLATPGLLKFGLRGYGEIPALALAMAALAVYPWSGATPRWRLACAAALLGATVTTKTVMLVCVAPFGLVMALHALTRNTSIASRAGSAACLVLGFLAPLVAWEAYRLASLGGSTAYHAWWGMEYASISREAGVDAAAAKPRVIDKLAHHMRSLSGFLRLTPPLTAAWLLTPFLLAPLIPRKNGPARWIVAALLAAAAAYFAWWLLLTPTEKAWHRRIFNGMILVNIAWVVVGAACAAALSSTAFRHRAGRAAMVLGLCFGAAFLVQTRLHDALKPVDLEPIHRAVKLLGQLPADGRLYAAGWSSAPQISLLARRPLLDINDAPFAELASGAPTFLVVDQEGGHTASTNRILDMYPSIPLVAGNALPQVYRFDATRLSGVPALSDLDDGVGLGELANNQTLGFHKVQPDGRWASADGAVRTLYGGQALLAIEVYILAGDKYAGGRAPAISVELNDCELPAVEPGPGLHTLEIPVAPCAPQAGEPVTIRIQSNALVASSITVDERALAFITKSIQLRDPEP